LLLSRERAAPLAYIGGSLGTLIGADLFNLSRIRELGAPVASIGGAGNIRRHLSDRHRRGADREPYRGMAQTLAPHVRAALRLNFCANTSAGSPPMRLPGRACVPMPPRPEGSPGALAKNAVVSIIWLSKQRRCHFSCRAGVQDLKA
jgi:hypothetical protein